MARKEPWKDQYAQGEYETRMVGGSAPRQGVQPHELDRVEAYFRHRAGPPVYEDRCGAPTNYSPLTFLLGNVAVVLPGQFKYIKLSGPTADLERTVTELNRDLGLREREGKKK